MTGERFVVVGLAHARSAWFSDVSRWATSAALPIEFIKCLSREELRTRLVSGRPFSAVLVDGRLPGVDRDLLDEGRRCAGAVLVVDDGRADRDWKSLGASAVLGRELTRTGLLDALESHCVRIRRGDTLDLSPPVVAAGTSWRGLLVAVTGPGGTGVSMAAMALAAAIAADVRYGGMVVLADFALDADQAVLHDAGDVVPGIQELVDAHRLSQPSFDEIRNTTFTVPARGYHLLLGLRRHRDWASIRPRSFEAALHGLRLAFRAVVADVDDDVEGEAECGSMDVEERNTMARSTIITADAVVVVGLPGVKGVIRLVRTISALLERGVAPERLVPVFNRVNRSPRARAELTAALAELSRPLVARSAPGSLASKLAPPVFLPERNRLDELLHDGIGPPASLGEVLAGAVRGVLGRTAAATPGAAGARAVLAPAVAEPVLVTPGSLGRWTEPLD